MRYTNQLLFHNGPNVTVLSSPICISHCQEGAETCGPNRQLRLVAPACRTTKLCKLLKKIFVIYLKKNRKGYKKLKNNLENIYDEFRKTQEKT